MKRNCHFGCVQICYKMTNKSSAGMACGEEVVSDDWKHVKNCTFDACKATFDLQDVSSLTK